MATNIFNWLLEIPRVVGWFGNWLISPISTDYLNISPLGLFGIGGGSVILAILAVHIVRLFI